MEKRVNKYIEARKRQQGGIVKCQNQNFYTDPSVNDVMYEVMHPNLYPIQEGSIQDVIAQKQKELETAKQTARAYYGDEEYEKRQDLARKAAAHDTITQQKAPVPKPQPTVAEYNAALRVAEDEAREERYRNGGNFLDDALKGSMLGSGVNRFINGQNWYDIPLGMGQAALGTLMLAGGANMVAPRVSLKTSVPTSPTTPKYTLLNSPTSFATKATNFAKSMAIGIPAGEAVNQTPRLWSGKTWNENVIDSTFLKNIQKAYPAMADFVASLTNPGYYLGFGAKGLEYTGALGKQLANGISNGVNSAKNLFTKYTSRINPVTGKFEIVPEKTVGKDVAVRPVDFKSELDWNPENWFSKRIGEYGLPFDAHHNPKGYTENDIKSLQSHIPEYIEIERKTKADDTWLKMPDGSTWSGDPRSWVQLMSSDGQKLELQRLLTGVQRNEQYSFPTYTGNIWASDSKQFADHWAPDGKSFEISYPKTSKTVTYDAKGDFWMEMDIDGIPKDGFHNKVSNGVVKYGISQGNDIVKIKNIVEAKQFPSLTDIYIRDGVPSKIIEGNNGNFDLSVLNKYRILIPFILPLINKNNEKNNNQN